MRLISVSCLATYMIWLQPELRGDFIAQVPTAALYLSPTTICAISVRKLDFPSLSGLRPCYARAK